LKLKIRPRKGPKEPGKNSAATAPRSQEKEQSASECGAFPMRRVDEKESLPFLKKLSKSTSRTK
jgi:hypothetical protein